MRGAGEPDRESSGRRPDPHSHRAPPPASDSEDDSVSEAEMEEEGASGAADSSKFLLPHDDPERTVDPEMQARLEALLEAAGIGKLSGEGKHLADPEVLRRLTSSVSCALDEAAAALTRMRSDQPAPSHRHHPDKPPAACGSTATGTVGSTATTTTEPAPSLAEACSDGDVGTVRKLLTEGRSVHETTEEGESLLSLACSAGYYELAQVLLAMHASVEDRGIKGDCTPLMEAASAGHVDIVRLLIAHGADVNAQSGSGNTPLMYACAGGHETAVQALLEAGANVEDHNENGHTPLMEAASAGHVGVAKILLEHGAGINTHSNEFKESALTLACYKGHLDMVRFLLAAGADREHKTDEMHTALMEASMDGHVEVARLLLDSGAQVNMPTDSFESPLTLAACGGHVELAMLLLERGANIEEVNDEGYTPLMEAAREGHEEMVALLLGQGAAINAQTDETQETALTLACCGGFLDVAEFLIKAGADAELGASTPLMEASQEGHLELVKYLLGAGADVHAQTQTGDTALTYACENGHTDVAMELLRYGADLEHESEGGRTPLMKACRAGHLCTVQFLVGKGADVNRVTANGDHTPLSLACAGGHAEVVKFLLACDADPFRKLKDNSTTLIEAAKGGHTAVVQLLLDYPHSVMMARGAEEAGNGLSAAQAAQLGLGHIPGPGAPHQRALVPVVPPAAVGQPAAPAPSAADTAGGLSPEERLKVFEEGKAMAEAYYEELARKKGTCAPTPAPTLTPGVVPPGTKHKCAARKASRSAVPPTDHHLPPPPDIDHQVVDKFLPTMDQWNEIQKGMPKDAPRDEQMLYVAKAMAELKRADTAAAAVATTIIAPLEGEAQDISTGVTTTPIFPQQQPFTAQQPLLAANVNQNTAIEDRPKAKPVSRKECKQARKTLVMQALKRFGLQLTEDQFVEQLEQKHQQLQQQLQQEKMHQQKMQQMEQQQLQQLRMQQQKHKSLCLEQQQQQQALEQMQRAEAYIQQQQLEEQTTDQEPVEPEDRDCEPVEQQDQEAKTAEQQKGKSEQQLKAQLFEHKIQQMEQQRLQQLRLQQQMHKLKCIEQRQKQQQEQELKTQENQKRAQELKAKGIEQLRQKQQLGHKLRSLENLEQQCQKEHEKLEKQMEQQRQEESSTLEEFKAQFVELKMKQEQEETVEQQDHECLEQCLEQQRLALRQMQIAEAYVQQSGGTVGAVEARELGAVLAYLQREVPSLVALPPAELRTLVLQVMQQKSNEILQQKSDTESRTEGEVGADGQLCGGDEQQARRLLAAAAQEALTCGRRHSRSQTSCGREEVGNGNYRLRPPSPATSPALPWRVPPADAECEEPEPNPPAPFNTNPPAAPFHEPFLAQQAPPPTATAAVQAQQTVAAHGKRDASTTATTNVTPPPLKKKGRIALHRQLHKTDAAPGYPHPHPPHPAPAAYSAMDVDGETDSNHDTALTLACAGGHEELVELLLSRGADIEHRDKKGFTPLILAATAGHEKIVEILLNHGADIEAQSERTKDTPLSLACSGGRYEVVELCLARGANKEHRNVSDYTPLSLAASGGYVNIIRLLLHHQAEINSRTGSKLGISPLMLAAMNGHTAAVRLLLDCGSDINAQIETNRNTALTLACFQGRHEVVSLLLDRKANVEHRAKTGLTPLMEAASGGYVEVGRVLLDKGADVNAPPVPSSRDTALTIAADKGHARFVELLLQRRAAVEVKNKKGNSPLWLAANGGHLSVVEMLYAAAADIDSQDNRKVSCLMAAFRKGHTKVVKWMVGVVTQFPSDQEMTRYIYTISDKELLEKCQECVRAIRAAKETQAARANQNADILLEELKTERCREQSKRQAAARRRERKKKKKMEKKVEQEERRRMQETDKSSVYSEKASGECSDGGEGEGEGEDNGGEGEEETAAVGKEEGDSGIDANSQGSCSSSDVKPPPTATSKAKKKKKDISPPASVSESTTPTKNQPDKLKMKSELKPELMPMKLEKKFEKENVAPTEQPTNQPPPLLKKESPVLPSVEKKPLDKKDKRYEEEIPKPTTTLPNVAKYGLAPRKGLVFESTRHGLEEHDFDKNRKYSTLPWETEMKNTSPKGGSVSGRREDGWKEVVRKSSVQALSTVEPGCKKVSVAAHAISRVIGRAGSNINAIRSATGAHIEVDKQGKGQGERIITIKGSAEATKQAAMLIAAMIRDPDADISHLLPRTKMAATPAPIVQLKPAKQPTVAKQQTVGAAVSAVAGGRTAGGTRTPAGKHTSVRIPPPRMQGQAMEKRASSTTSLATLGGGKLSTLTYALVGSRPHSHTFASTLTSTTPDVKPRVVCSQTNVNMSSGIAPTPLMSKPPPCASEGVAPPHPPPIMSEHDEDRQPRVPPHHSQMSPESVSSWCMEEPPTTHTSALHINTSQQSGAQEYTLFKDLVGGMWGPAPTGDSQHSQHNPDPPPVQADASKAPGYRGGGGGGCSPCSRTSSHSSTPPPMYQHTTDHVHTPTVMKSQTLAIQRPNVSTGVTQPMQTQVIPPIGPPSTPQPIGNGVNTMDMGGLTRNGPIYQDNSRNGHNMMVSMSSGVGVSSVGLGYVGVESVSRLNPRAPDFHQPTIMHHNHNAQLFASGSSGAGLGTLLMSYQQSQQPPAKHQQPPMHHPYQSLLERGVGALGGWGEEEERKPKPIGTERAWKMTAPDDWPQPPSHMTELHRQPDHDRYQTGVMEPGEVSAGGATAAALSLMHALPLHYLPSTHVDEPRPHWDTSRLNDKQGWSSKWSH